MHDVVIIGAGPVGLALAVLLAREGLSPVLVERQPEAALADPAFDGREIALTHHSRALLERIGAWDLIPAEAISPLRQARVLNGADPFALTFDTGGAGRGTEALGFLVANHLIRRALYGVARSVPAIDLRAGTAVERVATGPAAAELHLAGGEVLQAPLTVAADTRFSQARKQMGIAASVRDFRRSMLVCRVEHTAPHGHVATEWFDYGQTVALLPLNGGASSLVLTRAPGEIARLMELPPLAFEAEMTRALRRRGLGPVRLASTRHSYPLAATYARHFASPRFALAGDAAVGMLPITAHGFNLGLRGAETLADAVAEARRRGGDIGAPAVLRRFEAAHRLATGPLYAATNAIAALYSREDLPARLARHAVLRVGGALSPIRQAVSAMLMDRGATPGR
ncbi:5-demethoxyubiquinol-8 5-hydroxylase UbiM [Roseomonas populi]|uniref:5-demethoxyubiquinol-8 5-hydroxylase UbiM n=1 Tax=Roseomonas populi TaxID=3121582 RepID=A0ABT1X5Z8_9PROT|nr:5-demethoxyubiquinol-8 5-hydroxylase UbiM [Roseomonas pecuniae]MCR0983525.1 5-demethoxyubiquinol-8 5-hydroxylase UbiM [Roseomonas pecuniae]